MDFCRWLHKSCVKDVVKGCTGDERYYSFCIDKYIIEDCDYSNCKLVFNIIKALLMLSKKFLAYRLFVYNCIASCMLDCGRVMLSGRIVRSDR